MLSLCGSVLAQRRNSTSLGLCMSGGRAQALVVHHPEAFSEHHLLHAPEAVHDFVAGARASPAAMAGVAPDIMLSPYEDFVVTPKRTRESRVLPPLQTRLWKMPSAGNPSANAQR